MEAYCMCFGVCTLVPSLSTPPESPRHMEKRLEPVKEVYAIGMQLGAQFSEGKPTKMKS